MKTYNKLWKTWFVTSFVVLIVLRLILNKASADIRNNILFLLSILLVIYFIAYRYAILKTFKRGTPEYFNYFPFYPCNIVTFILPLAILTDNITLKSCIMLYGSVFPLLAVIIPSKDAENIPIMKASCLGYYICHYALLIISAIYTSFADTTGYFWIFSGSAAFAMILLIQHLINTYFRKTEKFPKSNFGWTYDTEEITFFNMIYKIIPYRYFYILIFVPIFMLYGLLLKIIIPLI